MQLLPLLPLSLFSCAKQVEKYFHEVNARSITKLANFSLDINNRKNSNEICVFFSCHWCELLQLSSGAWKVFLLLCVHALVSVYVYLSVPFGRSNFSYSWQNAARVRYVMNADCRAIAFNSSTTKIFVNEHGKKHSARVNERTCARTTEIHVPQTYSRWFTSVSLSCELLKLPLIYSFAMPATTLTSRRVFRWPNTRDQPIWCASPLSIARLFIAFFGLVWCSMMWRTATGSRRTQTRSFRPTEYVIQLMVVVVGAASLRWAPKLLRKIKWIFLFVFLLLAQLRTQIFPLSVCVCVCAVLGTRVYCEMLFSTSTWPMCTHRNTGIAYKMGTLCIHFILRGCRCAGKRRSF